MSSTIKKETITVIAKPAFRNCRWITLKGISKKEYRDLQFGKTISIDKNAFNSSIFEKVVKHGDK
ncbi:MAG TPA: hypothetical protein VIH28_09615 [Ignavibacteriaceae bacterium]